MSDATAEPDRLVRENEALRRRVAALEAEAERFRTTLQSIGDAVISVDKGGNILQMNPVAQTLTGWGEVEALGLPLPRVFRIVNEETRAEVASPVERVLREGTVVGLANHTLLIAKDGSERPIADSGAPIRSAKGETNGVVLVFRDQSEERRAEKNVRAAEERFRTFFDNAPIGKCMTAPDGRLLRVNPAFGAMLGYSVDEMQTLSFASITHPDDMAESQECVRALLAGERDTWAMDKRYIAKDGRHVWTRVTTRLQRDDEGKPLHLLTHIQDITERKAMEHDLLEARESLERRIAERTAELQWSRELLAETSRLARVGGWEIDLQTNELSWTEVVHQIHEVEPGYRPTVDAAIDFYAPEAVPVISEAVRRTIEEGVPYDVELQLITAKKNRVWVRTIGEAIRKNGRIVKVRGVFQDINQRKLAEVELKKHREHLEELVDARTAEVKESQKALVEAQTVARVGSWQWDAVRDQITGSQEFYRLFDVAPEDIARFPQFAERLHPDDRERVEQDVAKALHLDRPYDTDYRVKLGNGTWRDINARGQVFTDRDGRAIRMAGTCLDITERKRAEEKITRLNSELEAKVVERTSELKDEMELVQKIVSASPVGVFACRSDGPCVLANPALARISGAPVEKLLQLNFHELPEWKKNGLHDKAQAALATGVDQHAEVHLTTSFGRDAWLSYTFTTFERGGVPHFLMLVDDITARKRMEIALRESEELSRTTLYSIGDGVIATDAAGRVARMNPVAELLTGWSEAEAGGKPLARVFRIINEETRTEAENPVEHALREGKAVGLANHTLLVARDGTERPIADSGAPIRNEKGEVTGVVLVFRDRTDERAAQKALHEHAAQLQESNQELEAFSYSVSHDLRAPLRAIDGFTRILADDYASHLDAEGKRLCSVIRENTGKMSRLIDDLLAFSRLGRAEMSLSRTDMETMANSVFHELTTPENLARIDFQVGALPPALADPTLMRQVWMNLLANAIKFSSKQERAVIKVSAQQNQGESVYVVQDNGAGFEMQYVGKLFGVFQRLHSSKEFEGTGVGLALVQRVIRRHGGRVWAEGEIDKGATFYFALQQRGA